MDRSKPYRPLSQEHKFQIYENYFEPHFDNDPTGLQHKIYFDLAYYMGKRGTEGLRSLKKDSFEIKQNNGGREYLELVYNESTKKSDGTDHDEIRENAILLSQPGSRKCPITSFKLYMSKLTKLNDFFQQPNPYFKKPNKDFWYKA